MTSRYLPPTARSENTVLVPGTAGRIPSICLPIRSSVSRLGPKILIPTGVLMPVVSMSSRFLIGIDHMLPTPGVFTVAFASLTIESYVTPGRHSLLSLRMAIVSIIDIGAMSVARLGAADLAEHHAAPPECARARRRAAARSASPARCRRPGKSEGMSMIDALVQRRHELAAEARPRKNRRDEDRARGAIVGQRWRSTNCDDRSVDADQKPIHRIRRLRP